MTTELSPSWLNRRQDWRPAVALLTVGFCLLLIHYMKFHHIFQQTLDWLALQGNAPAELAQQIRQSQFFVLYGHVWWGIWHVIGYLLIPFIVIKLIFRERIRDNGLHWADTFHYLIWYLILVSPIIGFAWMASFRPDFAAQYPFYGLASRSWLDLLTWESIYFIQFFCLEFFFRGFLLHACKPAFGFNAVFVMVVPYMMIHFPKPWLEATGAIFFGIFLGILALRSRSIWGGVAVHVSIALSMDLMALLHGPGLPKQWWP